MNKLKVAIIDDGINKNAYGINLFADYEMVNGNIIERLNGNSCQTTHGTECAAVFCKYAKDYLLYSIKVLNHMRLGVKVDLIKALEWCCINHIKLINLSIGSTHFKDYPEISEIIHRISLEGVVVVAACDNRNIRTYPASLPDVIGVKTDKINLLNKNEHIFVQNPYDGIEIIGYSKFIINTPDSSIIKQLSANNSYAAPYISALVCNYLNKNPDACDMIDIRRHLKKISVTGKDYNYEYMKSNIINWNDYISTPIITFVYNEEDKDYCQENVKELVQCFREDSYYCIACVNDSISDIHHQMISTNEVSNAFKTDYISSIRIINNIEMADVLILCINSNNINRIYEMNKTDGVDITIFVNNKDLYFDLKNSNLSEKAVMLQKEKVSLFQRVFNKERYQFVDIKKVYKYIKSMYN